MAEVRPNKGRNLKMAKKKFYLIVDTETAGNLQSPLPYDIGYKIVDRKGNVYAEKAFVVNEVFYGLEVLMQSCYFADKIPSYHEQIRRGEKMAKSGFDIAREMYADIKEYGVTVVGAYNMAFDLRALNNLCKFLTQGTKENWFPKEIEEFICIWHMATQTICSKVSYIKTAIEQGWVSEKGNIQTSAEVVYRYITQQFNFVEEHKGLEDVEIEVDILVKVFSMKVKVTQSINTSCWQIPQQVRKNKGL